MVLTMPKKYKPSLQTGQPPRDADEVRRWLAVKPEILANAYKQTVDSGISSVQAIQHAEMHYQAILNKRADTIYSQYQHLSVEQKIDLLAYAENIAQINSHIRENAVKYLKAKTQNHYPAEATLLAAHPRPTDRLSGRALLVPPPAVADTPDKHFRQAKPVEENKPPLVSKEKPSEDNPLLHQVGLGNPGAFTINLPFTHIPGLLALNQILEKIDRTTHFDLGFTLKGSMDKTANPQGGYDLAYKISYTGFGIMSSKANMQFAPIALKMEDSEDTSKWGGSTSIFTKQHSDGLGSKYTVNANDSDASLSYAHEYSYQRPSTKIISTLTVGKHHGSELPIIRIPAANVPTFESVVQSMPNQQELGIIMDRIDKVIPWSQAYRIGESVLESAVELAKKAGTNISLYALKQHIIQSGLEESAQHRVITKIHENTTRLFQRDIPLAKHSSQDDDLRYQSIQMLP